MAAPGFVFIAASLDGFIARQDGDIAWLTEHDDPGGEDYGFKTFMDSVDALVMGRATFDKVLSMGGDWPYGAKRVIVLSTRELGQKPPQVERMSGPPREIVARLADRGAKRLYVDGGKTIQTFLREGLVERITITHVPILLGRGIPLFGALPHDVRLRHESTRAFPNGLVQSTYAVAPGSP
ncbi:MAG TPA: dihydrofolate reductase family protein [Anaeromyxobacter sp.]|nr:dihydrofolate reductase family protein [Anaeromyxobacter sp.]